MKRNKEDRMYVKTIGIAGSQRHVGTTHLAIMIANYLASKEKCKTAILEMNETGTFQKIQELYEQKERSQQSFQLYYVDYYKNVTERLYANIFQSGYEYIIIDYGNKWKEYPYEWQKCIRKIVVGSCNKWEKTAFCVMLDYIERFMKVKQCTYVTLFGASEVKKELEKAYGIKISDMPFEADPYTLHKNNFTFLQNLL